MLIDESADEKAGAKSAGAGRQSNGRLGKVEMSQVAVLLSYLNLKVAQGFWRWIDGALFLPEGWFRDSHEKLRQRLGVPPETRFKTKVELAWELIERALAADLPCDLVGFDCLDGLAHHGARPCGLGGRLPVWGMDREARLPPHALQCPDVV